MNEPPETEDHAANRVARKMFCTLEQKVLGRPMTEGSARAAEEIVHHYTRVARASGITFPDLAVIVLPLAGGIEVVRRDLDIAGIRMMVINLTVKYPNVSVSELAHAVRTAWPHVNPGELIDGVNGRPLRRGQTERNIIQ